MDFTKRQSMDSLEKVMYAQIYNKTNDGKVSARPAEKANRRLTIDKCIERFFLQDDTSYKRRNFHDLERIKRYLSEFQVKSSEKENKQRVVVNNKIKGVSWCNQLLVEQFSANAKARNLDERSAWLGTGVYPLNKPFEKLKVPITFGLTNRFQKKEYTEIAGPGSFGNRENFHTAESHFKKPVSLRPSFEWCPSRTGVKVPDYHLSPCTYKLEDRTISSFIKKSVTERGPYDTFTGPRDLTTIKNHFGLPALEENKSWPMAYPSIMETISKSKNSDWSKSLRLMTKVKNPTFPAPGAYQKKLMRPKTWKQNKYPFNSNSASHCCYPSQSNKLTTPGPGRYFIENALKPLASIPRKMNSKTAIP